MPNTDTRGSEAIKLPSKGSFLDTSEIRTINPAEIIIFITYQTINSKFPELFLLEAKVLSRWDDYDFIQIIKKTAELDYFD